MFTRKERNVKLRDLHKNMIDDNYRSIKEICDRVGISHRTFYNWKDRIKNFIEEEEPKQIIKLAKYSFPPLISGAPPPVDEYSNFIEIPIIQEYKQMCKINKKHPHLSHLFRICNASKTTPTKLSESLINAKTAFIEFDDVYHLKDKTLTNEKYRKVLRAFLQFRSITIPNKDPVIHGGSDSQGDYATVSLTPGEVTKVADILSSTLGEKYYDLFRIHHETFPRPQTLYSWMPVLEIKYVDVDGHSLPFGQTSVYESKQKKHYNKLILEPNALQIIDKYNGKNLVDQNITFRNFIDTYSKGLKNAYYSIGKIMRDQKYPKGVEGWLWFNKPIYAIRHSAAVQWINRTSFDVNLVATMGWEKPDTLTKYYARISTNNIMEKGVCYYCAPPSVSSAQPVFCSAPHALAYIHGMRRHK